MTQTPTALGEVIRAVYNEFLAQYGDEDLASVATAAVVNDWLTGGKSTDSTVARPSALAAAPVRG